MSKDYLEYDYNPIKESEFYKESYVPYFESDKAFKNITILEFIDSYKSKDRDKKVMIEINKFYKQNVAALADGIVKDYIKIGPQKKNQLLAYYNIPKSDFDKLYKTNVVLKKNFETIKDRTKLCLIVSYHDTKDKNFLYMLALIEYGSKFHRQFPHGIAVPARMKHTIENLSKKFLIKQHGSIFRALQETIETVVTSPNVKKNWDNFTDKDIESLINSIANRISSMVKNIAEEFYKNTEDVIFTQTEYGNDDNISLDSNYIIINNIKSIIDNLHPTSLDADLFRIMNVNSNVTKFILNKLLIDPNKKYFKDISYKYIDYYISKNDTDLNKMRKNFLPYCMKARPDDKDLKKINDEMYKDVIKYYDIYNDGESSKKLTNSEIVDILQNVKKYTLLKVSSILIKKVKV